MTCRYCRKLLCDSLNVETEIRIYFKDGDRDLLTDSIVVVTHTSKIRGKCFDNELLSPPPLRPPLSHPPPPRPFPCPFSTLTFLSSPIQPETVRRGGGEGEGRWRGGEGEGRWRGGRGRCRGLGDL